MINNYKVNSIDVIGINKYRIGKRNQNVKCFDLENGSYVNISKLKKDSLSIKCSSCGKYISINWGTRYEYKKYVCNHCRTIGENNPFFGKKHTIELKNRLSKERKGIWYVGKDNPMYGIPCYYKMSEVEKEKWKKKISTAFKNKSEDEWKLIKQKISDSQKRLMEQDIVKYKELKSKAGKISISKHKKYEINTLEKIVYDYLYKNQYNFDYCAIMGNGDKNYQFDFIIHKKRILIEIDGDYWHGNPDFYNINGSDGKRKLNNIQLSNIKNDREKDIFAKEHNFKLIRIWETDVNNNNYKKIIKENCL